MYTAELAAELLQNYTYSATLNRAVFGSTEEVFIGTALRDFTFMNTQVITTGALYYAHIEVVNPRLSASKKALEFNLTTVQIQANINNIALKFKRLTLSYIIVGEQFEGHYDSSGIPSSYIFTRNSQMITPATAGTTLVDFKTSSAESPFLYDPTTSNYKGCGAVKRNGNWII